jgi:hypothetical protein
MKSGIPHLASTAFATLVWVLAEAPARLEPDGTYTFQGNAPISAWRRVETFSTKAECEGRLHYLDALQRQARWKELLPRDEHGRVSLDPKAVAPQPAWLAPMRCIFVEPGC